MTCFARRATLATKLVGGDDTNKSIVHPIRWPGSWHRKRTPRLAKIVASSDDNEIDLAEAVERPSRRVRRRHLRRLRFRLQERAARNSTPTIMQP